MKKFISYFGLILVGLILTGTITFAAILFFKPTLIVNPQSLAFVLNKSQVLKEWKWDKAEINHQWISWDKRIVSGSFHDFCFEYEEESITLNSCLQELSWNIEINYSFEKGFKIVTTEPLKLISNIIQIEKREVHSASEKEPIDPPDVLKHWTTLWSEVIPDVLIQFDKIVLTQENEVKTFDLSIVKNKKQLNIKALNFSILADPATIELKGPPAYALPGQDSTHPPIHLRDFKLKALIKKSNIPIQITGLLEVAPFKITTHIPLPIREDPTSLNFIRSILLNAKASLEITSIKQNLAKLAPPPFNELPAPLNAMEGLLKVNIVTEESDSQNSILIKAMTEIAFESNNQALKLDLILDTPFNLETYSPGQVTLKVDFRKVVLQLPRISRKQVPPQFYPDPRINRKQPIPVSKKSASDANSDLSIRLTAEGKNALHIKTDLLDEDLRINFDLNVENGNLKEGFVDILTLNTKIFKRPIKITRFQIKFQHPKDPLLKADIHFLLPEYKILMALEGPLSKPNLILTSTPPLPRNDIYAVLLFGRPLADLDPDSQVAANRTNQMLAQGILSLSILYFLAGSPIEYVGYDPSSGEARAQIGLGKKTSLRVGAGQGGSRSTGIRRSLGKGWYLDNSVQNKTSGNSETRDYLRSDD
jgi:hypothetical protein